MTRLRQARLRVRLTAASFALSLIIVTGAVGALAVVLRQETNHTITARLQERAVALSATIVDQRGQADVVGADEALFDGPNWVFDAAGRQVEGPAGNGQLTAPLRSLATIRSTRTLTAGPWHLRALPVRGRDGLIAVAVTGVNDAPYAETLAATLRAAVLLGLLAVIGATGLAALVLSRSLVPIATMTEQAAGWTRTHSGARFALGPPRDEISRLAAVLDDLLDRVQAALDAERRLTAEIAHELRTPLTLLTGEAQLALMDRSTAQKDRDRFGRMQTAADTMARAITTLLADATATAERDREADPAQVLQDLLEPLHFDGAVVVQSTSTRVNVPAAVLERMVAPVLDNAVKVARSSITLQVSASGSQVTIRVQDDGPGVDPAVRGSLFEPGVSARRGGTGIGLSLARRLARDAGGEIDLVSMQPAAFEIRLPAASAINAQ